MVDKIYIQITRVKFLFFFYKQEWKLIFQTYDDDPSGWSLDFKPFLGLVCL